MVKFYLLLFFSLLLCSNQLFAQRGRSIRVKAGEDMAQAYSPSGFYRFPQFAKATLYFKERKHYTGNQINFNMLSGTLQFISPVGDTLDLVGEDNIDSVSFEDNVFLYNDGFIEIVAVADSVTLLKKTNIKTQTENIGAYGLPSSTANILKTTSYSTGTGVYNLVLNQDVVVTENVDWFFTKGNNILVKANKSNFLKLLPAEKLTKAEAYLKRSKPDFDKADDLEKLMDAIKK